MTPELQWTDKQPEEVGIYYTTIDGPDWDVNIKIVRLRKIESPTQVLWEYYDEADEHWYPRNPVQGLLWAGPLPRPPKTCDFK